jgi:hypothetical protein
LIVIEASEESGSPDLPIYMDALAERIGKVSLVVCLDSGCGDYDRLWLTTSLRGMVGGTLRVDVLEEGVHSGDASGVVPSSFRVSAPSCWRAWKISKPVRSQRRGDSRRRFRRSAKRKRRSRRKRLGDQVYAKFPFVDGMKPNGAELDQLVLNRTWRPALSDHGLCRRA